MMAFSQRGFSLVELMVSITLGIILTFGVVEIYAGSKQTYRTQEALSRLQENARFALDILAKDIRTTGYLGCDNLSKLAPTESGVTFNYSATGVLRGNQSTGTDGTTFTGTLPTGVTAANRVPHTDVIQIQGAGSCSTPLTADMGSTTANIAVAAANTCGFAQNDVVIVSHCEAANIFRITNAPAGGAISHIDLGRTYATADGSELMTFSSNSYYIGTDVSGLPALFMVDNTALTPAPVALVEGVENLQLQYGIDTDSDNTPNQYVNADGVTDWSLVVVARISLLMRTIENVGAQGINYTFGGTDVDYAGGPIRQRFVRTVKLRNRAL